MIIDRFAPSPPRDAQRISRNSGKFAGARAGHTMFTSLSLFRPVVDRPGDENGIRYAIVASHDDNHGSLSPISIYVIVAVTLLDSGGFHLLLSAV